MRFHGLSLAVGTVLGVAVFLFSGCNSIPAVSPNYTKQVKSSAPVESRYIALGRHSVSTVTFEKSSGKMSKIQVWYPANMASIKGTLPVVVMANGTGVAASRYSAVFEHLASWGFIVVGNDDPESWSGKSTSVSLDYILRLNSQAGSVFYGKVDTGNIGVAGHSQGGVAVFNAVGNYSNGTRYKVAYTASCAQIALANNLKWPYNPSKLRIPLFMVAGTGKWDTETIAPLASLKENMSKIAGSVPVVIARRSGKDHGEMLAEADAYMTAWFCYWLKGDQQAAKAFKGTSPEIASNSRWQNVARRGM